jgi:hypothetical protein
VPSPPASRVCLARSSTSSNPNPDPAVGRQVKSDEICQEYSSKVQQRGHSSRYVKPPHCFSHEFNALWRQPRSWLDKEDAGSNPVTPTSSPAGQRHCPSGVGPSVWPVPQRTTAGVLPQPAQRLLVAVELLEAAGASLPSRNCWKRKPPAE